MSSVGLSTCIWSRISKYVNLIHSASTLEQWLGSRPAASYNKTKKPVTSSSTLAAVWLRLFSRPKRTAIWPLSIPKRPSVGWESYRRSLLESDWTRAWTIPYSMNTASLRTQWSLDDDGSGLSSTHRLAGCCVRCIASLGFRHPEISRQG